MKLGKAIKRLDHLKHLVDRLLAERTNAAWLKLKDGEPANVPDRSFTEVEAELKEVLAELQAVKSALGKANIEVRSEKQDMSLYEIILHIDFLKKEIRSVERTLINPGLSEKSSWLSEEKEIIVYKPNFDNAAMRGYLAKLEKELEDMEEERNFLNWTVELAL